FADTAGFTADLDRRGYDQFALSPRGRIDIRDARRGERLALYLGTEGEGLPERLLARLQTVRITMSNGFDSLNVAAASAIALHHFSR
ncbi:RNA methyltransferase, partial [Mesorhizobium sp. M00.F.Ca.ET.158.01.1.1]